MTMREEEYRKYIESDEAVDEILEAGEEVKMQVSPHEEREVRLTVRLKADEVQMLDKLCDDLGVGRSTALKIALRMASKGLVISSPLGVGQQKIGGETLLALLTAIEQVAATSDPGMYRRVARTRKGPSIGSSNSVMIFPIKGVRLGRSQTLRPRFARATSDPQLSRTRCG